MKLRAGASKWVLRQAVSDVLPTLVLNRRKVGFDTPSESWIRGSHASFVRDTLLSTRARQRGFWKPAEIEHMLDHPAGSEWFDQIWKALSIELWASVFLDSTAVHAAHVANVATSPPAVPESHGSYSLTEKVGHIAQECRELGIKGTLARGVWEAKTRTGLVRVSPRGESSEQPNFTPRMADSVRMPFADPNLIGPMMRELIPIAEQDSVSFLASEATRGRIHAFSRWMADYGNPIDWHRDPTTGHRWVSDIHWSKALRNTRGIDVKFTWEVSRFPQAYTMARAAALNPSAAPVLGEAFASQVHSFKAANPRGLGVHWFSGQEVAFRMFAWLFGAHVFTGLGQTDQQLSAALSASLYDAGVHIAEHIEYARDSVYNNHLLSEALGIYLAGRWIPTSAESQKWTDEGFELLDAQASLQIYPDGSYIQQAHNYHRVAMQVYLLATAFARANRDKVPASWLGAMERSLDFLYAHQNEHDGRLPNYGANDGSRPIPLASADFGDFRPVLQALSVATRGERIYPTGPWDETSLWLFGPETAKLPLRSPTRTSVSFAHTGHHVLRADTVGNFGSFRCGTIIDRFSQIDMLHLDVWWRGQNVLVDGGSFRYNGANRWHNHFVRTESHNTVKVDGKDQMVHFRQFKTLYWTQANLLRFEDTVEWTLVEGEHYGYQRDRGCTHRRSVLFVKDDLWVVADTLIGAGKHEATLQWLGGEFPWKLDDRAACMTLQTPEGPFRVQVLDEEAAPIPGATIVTGQDSPPRGWLARYYGRKVAIPSLVLKVASALPMTLVSVLSGQNATPRMLPTGEWEVATGTGVVRFRLTQGRFAGVEMPVEVSV
jgi:asparagine synthase (glutamine-hydrolysing)